MSVLRAARSRFLGLFGREHRDRDMAEEFAVHLQMETEENIRRGMPPAAARRAALLRSGGIEVAKEAYRDQRGLPRIDAVIGDLHFAARSLRRTPGFTVAAVLTLALGIAAATTVFSAAYGILLKPLPVADPSSLVALWGDNPTHQPEHFPLSGDEFDAYTRETRAFSGVAAYDYIDPWSLGARIGRSDVGDVGVSFVTGEFFHVLGAHPLLGRLLDPRDDRYGARDVGVISAAYWRHEFGGSPDVIGKTIRTEGEAIAIVGVAPPGLDFPAGTDLWKATIRDSTGRLHAFLNLIGRLKPGASLAQARGEFGAFLGRPGEPHSAARKALRVPLGPAVQPAMDVVAGEVGPTLRVVVWAVALLVLVTCVNVANMFLVRAVSRRREFAVRAALGASGGRLTQQLLVEGSVLAVAGGILGLAIASWGVRAFVALAPATIPRLEQVTMNGHVLAVSAALVIAVALVVGLLPAALGGRLSLADNLRDRGTADRGKESHRARSLLVGLQVSVAVLALVAAGLVGQSFERLTHVDLGFTPDHVLFVRMGVVGQLSPLQLLKATDAMLPRLRALPGVTHVAEMTSEPFQATGFDMAYSLPRDAGRSGIVHPWLDGMVVSPEFFEALGIRVLDGRSFTGDDRIGTPRVAVVDATFARQSWPGEDPIGRRVYALNDTFTVVGVAEPTRYRNLQAPRMTFYMPIRQAVSDGRWPRYLAIRTAADPAQVAGAVRAAIRQADARFFAAEVTPMSQQLDATTAAPRLSVVLLGLFAGAVLLLTLLGVYSIGATYARDRRFELAIRMALGAQAGQVKRLVVAQGIVVVFVGAVAGGLVAFAGAGLLHALLYGVTPRDPLTLGAAVTVVCVVALTALFVPAARAAGANPGEILREG